MKIISKISLLFLGMTAFFSCAESPSTDYVPVVPVDFSEVDTDTLSLRELICEDYLASYPEAMLYVDDELISTEYQYRFCVLDNVKITAKYEKILIWILI